MVDGFHSPSQQWHKVREHFCFLPLQISCFDRFGYLADVLCLDSKRYTDSWVTAKVAYICSQGHIFFSKPLFDELTLTLQSNLSIEQAVQIRARHQKQLAQLKTIAQKISAEQVDALSHESWTPLWSTAIGAIQALIPYALVTKVLPETIISRLPKGTSDLSHLHISQHLIPPFVNNLTASTLLKSLETLSQTLRVATPEQASQQIKQFCQEHVGHGSKAWEAPGYENVHFVTQVTHNLQPNNTLMHPVQEGMATAVNPWTKVLSYWRCYLDAQTNLLRWGFYVALLPLLQMRVNQLHQAGAITQKSDILFCTHAEIANRLPSPEQLRRRRLEYQNLVNEAKRPELVHAPNKLMVDSVAERRYKPMDDHSNSEKSGQGSSTSGIVQFQGESVARKGSVQGTAVLAQGFDLAKNQKGTIVIAKHLAPDLTPLLLNAAAVVVEEGGYLQHAAIVARELGIICIVGCQGIAANIESGNELIVDGHRGVVSLAKEEENESSTAA